MPKNDNIILRTGSRAALVSIVAVVILAILKAAAGYYTGLVVLIADALSSCADFLGLFASFVGLKISQRPADENFKYGYYKAETFAALITSILIIYFGIEILLDSIDRIVVMQESSNQLLAVIVVLVTIVSSVFLGNYLQNVGKKINSLSLMDSGKEKKLDILVQCAVLIGVGANYFRIPYIEGGIGLLISFLTLKVGFGNAKESLFYLLDYFHDPNLMISVEKLIRSKSHIVNRIRKIRMRRSGTFILGEAFLELNPFAQAKDIRNEVRHLTEEIRSVNPYMKDFLLFCIIPHVEDLKVGVPITSENGLQSEIAHTFDETKAYIFVNLHKNDIKDFYFKKFDFKQTQFEEIIRFLEGEKVNVVIDNDMHSLLYYHLRRLHNIEVYPNFSNVRNAENCVKLLIIDT